MFSGSNQEKEATPPRATHSIPTSGIGSIQGKLSTSVHDVAQANSVACVAFGEAPNDLGKQTLVELRQSGKYEGEAVIPI